MTAKIQSARIEIAEIRGTHPQKPLTATAPRPSTPPTKTRMEAKLVAAIPLISLIFDTEGDSPAFQAAPPDAVTRVAESSRLRGKIRIEEVFHDPYAELAEPS